MAKDNLTRVLIVDDSDLVRGILRDMLSQDPGIVVIGEARDGHEAVEQTERLRPDLITMDIQMPHMDGFAATEQIMAYTPTPILIFSSAIDKSEKHSSFNALALGALDVMSKPDITVAGFQKLAAQMTDKIRMLARIKVVPHVRGKMRGRDRPLPAAAVAAELKPPDNGQGAAARLVVIGASTGGPLALKKLLLPLPVQFPAGIAIVQHITYGFIGGFVDWLGLSIRLRVCVAEDGEVIRPGTVYFAPDDLQMQVSADHRIRLRADLPPWGKHRPSANHLLQSAGESYGERAVGIILTGMGDDGVTGLKAMRDRGALTIAQDQVSSLIYGMPRVAVESGAAALVLPLERIADELMRVLKE